jgi:hypothetical protein
VGALMGDSLLFQFDHSYSGSAQPTRWYEVMNDHGAIIGWTWLQDD